MENKRSITNIGSGTCVAYLGTLFFAYLGWRAYTKNNKTTTTTINKNIRIENENN